MTKMLRTKFDYMTNNRLKISEKSIFAVNNMQYLMFIGQKFGLFVETLYLCRQNHINDV